MGTKYLRARWGDGTKPTVGAWCVIGNEMIAETVADMGYDYIGIDMQHGIIDFDMTVRMIRAINLGDSVAVVRVPRNEPAIIGQVLDAGAMGLIAPMTNNKADVEQLVEHARYRPLGKRSFGPLRVRMREGSDYRLRANDEVALLPTIETKEALDNIEEIVSVPGIDGVYVAVAKLSFDIDLPPDENDGVEIFDEALKKIVAACDNAGIIAACHSSPVAAVTRGEQGFRMITAVTDYDTLELEMRGPLEAARRGFTNLNR